MYRSYILLIYFEFLTNYGNNEFAIKRYLSEILAVDHLLRNQQ